MTEIIDDKVDVVLFSGFCRVELSYMRLKSGEEGFYFTCIGVT
jgi:hypothetical protein